MNNLIYLLLFFLLSPVIIGCRKEPPPVDYPVTVKLFPSDGSYRTGGCFQLADGNYILYGFDATITDQPPLMIKTDPAGNIIWKKKLSNKFHYLRAKAVSGGNILVVGIEGNIASGLNVCMIAPDSSTLFSNFYYIDSSVRGRQQYLPDFVERKSGGFAITGHLTSDGLSVPFILGIDADGNLPEKNIYYSIAAGLDLRTAAIARNKDGYSITGGVLNPDFPRGIFFIRLDTNYKVMHTSMLYDESGEISVEGIIEDTTDNSNIICGSYHGQDFTGILYIRRITEEGEAGPVKTFTNYDNYGKFGSINHTQDGGYILAGTVDQILGFNLVSNEKIYLLKLFENLSCDWSRQFISENPLNGISAIQTAEGGYLAGGYEITSSYLITMLMIKTDKEGNIVHDF